MARVGRRRDRYSLYYLRGYRGVGTGDPADPGDGRTAPEAPEALPTVGYRSPERGAAPRPAGMRENPAGQSRSQRIPSPFHFDQRPGNHEQILRGIREETPGAIQGCGREESQYYFHFEKQREYIHKEH